MLCKAFNRGESHPMDNKVRYRVPKDDLSNKINFDELQGSVTGLPASHLPYTGKYRAGRGAKRMFRLSSLDNEDRQLLDNFYHETKAKDPFLDESLLSENLWDETVNPKRLGPLYDTENSPEFSSLGDGWTIDQSLVTLVEGNQGVVKASTPPTKILSLSEYSPTIRLLTSYEPGKGDLPHDEITGSGGKIIGATLYSNQKGVKPKVSSKSPGDAITLHNEMLEKPPNDGKVRVRMYYHRAIHDDVRLYGNGPWKYWGHGWGVEFGYDPRTNNKDDFYQKGYTIERAFGRDFCKDSRNCRQADPNFFKDPHSVGDYSREVNKINSFN